MSDDRQKLKALLLSEEIAQIKAIHELLNDKHKLSQKVSEVLDPATDLAIAQNPRFQKKFSKIDPRTYVKAIKANKESFIDALLPIIGPMIRKSVSSAIRKFVSDVNRRVELGFSAKALKWRMQAFRTGVPFAEIVFNNTIEYQVEQVFLIDHHSGLLIEYAGNEEALLQDKDAMSAMLTAIQDFVKDSVSKDGEGLSAAELGDNLVWIINGNKANIAAVIKGAPTQRLRDKIAVFLEEIHIDYHQQLEDQSQWNNSPELKSELESLLLTKTQSDDEKQPKGPGIWPWVFILLIPLVWLLWNSYQRLNKQQEINLKLQQTNGFVLTDLRHENNQFIATGLLDPLAELEDLGAEVVINSTPFISLDDDIVSKRVRHFIDNPEIEVTSKNNVLTIQGNITDTDAFKQKLAIIQAFSGVENITDLTTHKVVESLENFLTINPPPDTIVVKQSTQGLDLTGATTADNLKAFTDKLLKFGPINSNQVNVYSVTELQQRIEANPITIANPQTLNESQKDELNQIIMAFKQLNHVTDKPKLKLIAQSDCQGSIDESNQLNEQRMSLVEDYLIDFGTDPAVIMNENNKCATISDVIDKTKIGIWFEVIQ